MGEVQEAVGVELEEGGRIYADTVLSNATAHTTFLGLLPEGVLPQEFEATIRGIDYTSPVCKINGGCAWAMLCGCEREHCGCDSVCVCVLISLSN